MNFSYFIARRHLLGHHKIGYISFISIFSVIGLAVGVAALILTISILNGFENELKSKLIDFDSHIRLNLHYQDSMDSTKVIEEKLQKIPEIEHLVPYIHRHVMIRNKNYTDGVIIEGIPENDLGSSLNVSKFIKQGKLEFTTENGKNGIVLGEKLAEKLNLKLGNKVYLFQLHGTKGIGSRPKIGIFIVTGLYNSGISDYDDIFVYTGITAAQNLFNIKNSFSGFQIMLHNPADADRVSDEIDELLGFPYNAMSWNHLHANLFEWLRVQRFPVILIFGLITVVAVFNIVSSLMMIVIEKTRDIGILKSFGASNGKITKIFLYESTIIGFVGVSLGFTLALIIAWLQNNYSIISIPEDVYFMNKLPVLLDWRNFLYIGLGALFFSVTATIYPSIKANKLSPSEATKYE